jgi:hypothetical protein
MSSHPTSKARRRRQKLRRKYARLREDAQLAGVIETVPEGAVHDERVDPRAQSTFIPALPALVRRALRENWRTPDCNKPVVVDSLIEPFYDPDCAADPMLLVRCFRLLVLLDQTQYERDRAEQ